MTAFNLIVRPATLPDVTDNPLLPAAQRQAIADVASDVKILVFVAWKLVAIIDDYGTATMIDERFDQKRIEDFVRQFGEIHEEVT